MGQFILALARDLALVCIYAGAVAAIVNLPISLGGRFLLILASVWAVMVVRCAGALDQRLHKLELLARVSFIAQHIRNERDGLPPAMERLQADLREEKETEDTERKLAGPVGEMVYAGVGAIFVAALALFLNVGLFGDVAKGWISN